MINTPGCIRHWLCLLTLCCVSTIAWATDEPLIGYWQLVDQPFDLQIEFKPNGVYVAQTAMGAMNGRWERLDESHIATWSSENKPKRVTEFTLHGEFLTIIEADGTFLRHRRLGASRAN